MRICVLNLKKVVISARFQISGRFHFGCTPQPSAKFKFINLFKHPHPNTRMNHRTGFVSGNMGLALIMAVIVGLVLILVATSMFSGSLENPGEHTSRTVNQSISSNDCVLICFRCCQGLSGLTEAECKNPPKDLLGKSKFPEIEACHCNC